MEISKKTDYALRMIAELTRRPGEVLSVREAAEKNNVPYSFARSIQHDLAKVGLIKSIRGSQGGMMLACDPTKTTLLDIVEAVQGEISIEVCETAGINGQPCPFMSTCGFNPIWCGANNILSAYFDSITIDEIVNGTGHPSLPARFADPDAFEAIARASYEQLKS